MDVYTSIEYIEKPNGRLNPVHAAQGHVMEQLCQLPVAKVNWWNSVHNSCPSSPRYKGASCALRCTAVHSPMPDPNMTSWANAPKTSNTINHNS